MTKNPTSIRLGELEQPLRDEASEKERALHWLIIRILRDYLKSKGKIK